MRAGSVRRIIATHNPVRLFPEELKRTFKYCDMPSRCRSRKPRLSRLSGLKINVCAYTLSLCDLSCLSWFESWAAPSDHELELGSSRLGGRVIGLYRMGGSRRNVHKPYSSNVNITEALVGGRVGNPRGLTGLALARGHARVSGLTETATGRRGRHSLPGVGPTHFGSNGRFAF